MKDKANKRVCIGLSVKQSVWDEFKHYTDSNLIKKSAVVELLMIEYLKKVKEDENGLAKFSISPIIDTKEEK